MRSWQNIEPEPNSSIIVRSVYIGKLIRIAKNLSIRLPLGERSTIVLTSLGTSLNYKAINHSVKMKENNEIKEEKYSEGNLSIIAIILRMKAKMKKYSYQRRQYS